MVEWALIMGVVPPLSAQQWNEAFDEYQRYPEYRLTDRNIGLQRFNRIYLIEYGIQLTLGILTLVNGVPVLLAAAHQVGALCLLTAALCVSHLLCMPRQDYVAAD